MMEETTFNIRICKVCQQKFISDLYKDTCSLCGGRFKFDRQGTGDCRLQIRINDCLFIPYGDSYIDP